MRRRQAESKESPPGGPIKISILFGGNPNQKKVSSCSNNSGPPPRNGAPKCTSARWTAAAFFFDVDTPKSTSFVYRGSTWSPKAWPPMMRYLTPNFSKAANSSIKSEFSWITVHHQMMEDDQFPDRAHFHFRGLPPPKIEVERARHLADLAAVNFGLGKVKRHHAPVKNESTTFFAPEWSKSTVSFWPSASTTRP